MSIWSQAKRLAVDTPADRNRYVDFLRAVSITFVIIGHWLITTAHYDAGTRTLNPMLALDIIPWTSWLTWVFQVMPIFFIVGGYSNAVSLESAARHNTHYAQWLTGRLHRLLTPLLLLVVVWAGLSFLLHVFGAAPDTVRFLSRTALVPTWFLAIYTMIVLLAPLTYSVWRRWGYASLVAYIALAVLVDVAFFHLGWTALGWSNYFWVWLAMHHLGFAWRDGRLGGPGALLAMSAAALLTLVALILLGPYPIAMAGSPGDAVSNTLPPKVTLIALGLFQFGLLMALEKPAQKLLAGVNAWTVTVIVNTMIMTIYLWHMTVLLLVMGVAYLANGFGLTMEPGGGEWWIARPAWLLVMAVLLIPVALALSPLERIARPAHAATPPAWRLIAGAVFAGLGITLATLFGFDGAVMSLSNAGIIAVIGGAALCGISVRMGRNSR